MLTLILDIPDLIRFNYASHLDSTTSFVPQLLAMDGWGMVGI